MPKELREKFELLDRGDRLVLVPLPDEPLEALREEARDTDKTVDELKAGALAEALDEAGQSGAVRGDGLPARAHAGRLP